MSGFSSVFSDQVASAIAVASTGGTKAVKLGRHETKIAGSRAFLRLAAGLVRPVGVSAQQIFDADPAFKAAGLETSKSIGDAMCGNPAAQTGTSKGLGMARWSGKLGIRVDQVNAGIAVRCLVASGSDAVRISSLVGKSVQEFEEWVSSLPART